MIDPLLESLCSKRLDKFIRILVRLHMQHPSRNPCRLQKRNRPQRRLHTCFITVIRQNHLIRIPFQDRRMLARQCRAKRSHRIGKARLMQGNDIHVALTDNQIFFPCGPRNMQTV